MLAISQAFMQTNAASLSNTFPNCCFWGVLPNHRSEQTQRCWKLTFTGFKNNSFFYCTLNFVFVIPNKNFLINTLCQMWVPATWLWYIGGGSRPRPLYFSPTISISLIFMGKHFLCMSFACLISATGSISFSFCPATVLHSPPPPPLHSA